MILGIDARPLQDSAYSGVHQYLLGVLSGLSELGFDKSDFRLFANSWKGRDFQVQDWPMHRLHYPSLLFNLLMQRTFGRPKLDRLLGADVFWQPNLGFTAVSDDCRLVLTIHDLSFLRWPEFFDLRRRFWHHLLEYRRLADRADDIIVPSQQTADDVLELLCIRPEKIKIIPLGVRNLTHSPADIRRVRQKYLLPDDFIFTLSTIEPRKNISGLIRAFDLLAGRPGNEKIELLIGGAWGWHFSEVQKAWRQSRRRDRIRFLPRLPEVDLGSVLAAARLFAYPSFYEGFGLPPLEALSCGTPVIASSVSSLPEVLADWALYVDPWNASEMASVISYALNGGAKQVDPQEVKKKYSCLASARAHAKVLGLEVD